LMILFFNYFLDIYIKGQYEKNMWDLQNN
jgi:hypothetical protein